MKRRALIAGSVACILGCVAGTERGGAHMAEWVKSAGRVMICDNSIGVGYMGLAGGFRPALGAALNAAGVSYGYVGPHSDAYGSHRSVSGISAVQQSSLLQTDSATYRPRVTILGYCENDLGGAGGGQSRTPAQAIESMRSCIRWAIAGSPWTIPIVRTVVVPQTNGIPGYYSRRDLFVEYNALLPGLCLEEGAVLADIVAPTTTDGLHPDDTATGYPAIAAALAAVIIRSLPGGM